MILSVPVHYGPVGFVPAWYVPVRYFPKFLCPCTFHPWMSHNQDNSTNRGLVGHLAWPNLTLHMVSHSQQNSTNPWIGWPYPNPEYVPTLQGWNVRGRTSLGNNVRGRIIWWWNIRGSNVQGRIVPVPRARRGHGSDSIILQIIYYNIYMIIDA